MEAVSPLPEEDGAQLSEADFVNDGINEAFRVGPDFEVWKKDMLRRWGADIRYEPYYFTLCDYP